MTDSPEAEDAPCEQCGAQAGQACEMPYVPGEIVGSGSMGPIHLARHRAWAKVRLDR